MMTDLRKKILNEFAGLIAGDFSSGNVTDLDKIAAFEEVEVYIDQYENSFDGMLVYDDNDKFHIHLNIDRGNLPDRPRGRFSFAHELAHLIIEEHRIPLMKGEVAPHGSLHDFKHNDIVELEADYFASCLLMPEELFRKVSRPKKFSFDTITGIAKVFQTSILATVLRFVEVGSHDILVVVSENNIVRWYAKSKEFPNWTFRFKVGQPLPANTVAGEYFTKQNAKYTSVEDVGPESWFIPAWISKTQMHEQCYYSESYGYVISLIWFD
ncbi:MAG: ImmA/IrrE family metallo-endopeptidase [Ginsengibacter sp.]